MKRDAKYLIDIHWKPFKENSNVKCLNGSAYLRVTSDKNKVTCAACLSGSTNKYWELWQSENLNEWQRKNLNHEK